MWPNPFLLQVIHAAGKIGDDFTMRQHPFEFAEYKQKQSTPIPSGIRPPHPLDLKHAPVEGWKIFTQSWNNYAIITDMASRDNNYQKAMFLHCIGTAALKVFNTFSLPDDAQLEDIIKKFEAYILGETNETFERYKFNKRNQGEHESIYQFVTALKTLAATCNFCDFMKDSLLRDRLVTGVFSGDTRKRLLEQRKLTLSAAVDICRALEASKSQLKEMEPSVSQATESLNKVAFKVKGSRPEKSSFTKSTCKFCGGDHSFVKSKCPAYGRNCGNCGGRDHFAKVCKTKGPRTKRKTDNKVRNIEAESSTDSDSDSTSNWVKNVGIVPNSIKCKMLVKGKPLAFLID
ncbi:hypothetical protein RRG08_041669 [Elysia crispata]|uniref:Uncharacterized protein n=1 Tax=Elysia crispata TaxID=231223 RepID=A0AAE0YBB8_9GAST|nr:hypothetical protein RRG08_041669 [Elysia crispata]